MTTAVLLVLLGALSRLVPHPPNFVALGALALYSGARLPRRWAWAVPLAAMAVSDVFLDFGTGRVAVSVMRITVYGTFGAIVLAGRALSGRAGAGRLAAFSVGGLRRLLHDVELRRVGRRSHVSEDSGGPRAVFCGRDPVLLGDARRGPSRHGDALRPRRACRAAGACAAFAAAVLFAAAGPAFAQQVPPASESIVVTATSVPEDETKVGSAITVITREELEKNESAVVSTLLRSVPGLDVVQSGTPGSLTSLFTRGTNSTQTLVLIDGVRMNSPYFSGYDWSGMTTENVERIEIARGPFSALYGSDAIGGVVQIFTRPGADGVSGRATGEGGQRGPGAGLGVRLRGRGPVHRDGELPLRRLRRRPPQLRLAPAQRLGEPAGASVRDEPDRRRVGLERRRGRQSRTRRLAEHGAGHRRTRAGCRFRDPSPSRTRTSSTWLLAGVRSEPSYRDTAGGFASQTDAQTLQANVSDTARLGAHTLTAFASWQRWQVSDESNFGVNLDDDRTTLWGLGAQDSVTFGAFTIAAGLRYDHYSTYGDAWSPRGTISWLSSDRLWKVRASGGTGFRAPSIGELYYPFSGNPDLKPERSVSAEVGAERYFDGGRAEVSVFWNDLNDLIVYDFAAFRNYNVGNARTYGVELGWQQTLLPELAVNVTYMYLKTEDLATGDPLLRRPENSASAGLFLDADSGRRRLAAPALRRAARRRGPPDRRSRRGPFVPARRPRRPLAGHALPRPVPADDQPDEPRVRGGGGISGRGAARRGRIGRKVLGGC